MLSKNMKSVSLRLCIFLSLKQNTQALKLILRHYDFTGLYVFFFFLPGENITGKSVDIPKGITRMDLVTSLEIQPSFGQEKHP